MEAGDGETAQLLKDRPHDSKYRWTSFFYSQNVIKSKEEDKCSPLASLLNKLWRNYQCQLQI